MSEFRKSRRDATHADFQMEAAGLRWIGEADRVRVPAVHDVGGDPAWLVLERIPVGRLTPEGAEELGRGLAEMHGLGADCHGALPPGAPDDILRIGLLHLELVPADQWPALYAQMLVSVGRRALETGGVNAADLRAVDSVCERMESLTGPPEPPARLHGDLWNGNVLADTGGNAWLIDPAAYGGHREVDLAMLRLFGTPSDRIFEAYEEAAPLPDGHEERVELWQLLPLLVHAALFGGSYGAAAGRAASRYA